MEMWCAKKVLREKRGPMGGRGRKVNQGGGGKKGGRGICPDE